MSLWPSNQVFRVRNFVDFVLDCSLCGVFKCQSWPSLLNPCGVSRFKDDQAICSMYMQ